MKRCFIVAFLIKATTVTFHCGWPAHTDNTFKIYSLGICFCYTWFSLFSGENNILLFMNIFWVFLTFVCYLFTFFCFCFSTSFFGQITLCVPVRRNCRFKDSVYSAEINSVTPPWILTTCLWRCLYVTLGKTPKTYIYLWFDQNKRMYLTAKEKVELVCIFPSGPNENNQNKQQHNAASSFDFNATNCKCRTRSCGVGSLSTWSVGRHD